MDLNIKDMEVFDRFIKMKRNDPDGYKKHLENMESVMTDMMGLMQRSLTKALKESN